MTAASGRRYRIGLLHYVPKGDPFISTEDVPDFKAAMQRLGYREGVDVEYDERYGTRDVALAERQATEMVAAGCDLFCAFLTIPGISLQKALAAAGKSIPIIGWATDMAQAGLIDSYRRPGRNFTGFAYEPFTQWTKVRLLKMAVPGLTRLAHLYNPTYSPAPAVMRDLKQAAEAMALEFRIYETLRVEDFESSIEAMRRDGCKAAVASPHALFNRNGEKLGALFQAAGIAATGNQLSIARGGGIASFNAPKKRGWPLMALVAERILKGENAGDIPIDRTMRGPLTINLKSARQLGLSLPPALVEEADFLIE